MLESFTDEDLKKKLYLNWRKTQFSKKELIRWLINTELENYIKESNNKIHLKAVKWDLSSLALSAHQFFIEIWSYKVGENLIRHTLDEIEYQSVKEETDYQQALQEFNKYNSLI